MTLEDSDSNLISFWAERETERAIFKQKAAEALQEHQPIFLREEVANGDQLISDWVANYCLDKFCRINDLDPNGIELVHRQPNHGKKYLDFTGMVNRINDPRYISRQVSEHFYYGKLNSVAYALGVPLGKEEYSLIPRPLQSDIGPLTDFRLYQVMTNGAQIKQQNFGRELVVITQSGSQQEKRLSNAQVEQIVAAVKELSSQALVVVVSDREFIRQQYQTAQLRPSRTPRQQRSSFDVNEQFLAELDADIKGADQIIASTDINNICAWFWAADKLISVDGFWAWLSAGSNAWRSDRGGRLTRSEMVALHTLIGPEDWGIPGITLVRSEALAARPEMDRMSSSDMTAEYLDFYHQRGRGINQRDINSLIAALPALKL